MKRQFLRKLTSRIFKILFFSFFITAFFSCSRKSSGAMQGSGKKEDIYSSQYIKETMLKVTSWQLNNPKHSPTDWTNGAFYAGVVAAYKTTGSTVILDSLMALDGAPVGSLVAVTTMQMILPSPRRTLIYTGLKMIRK